MYIYRYENYFNNLRLMIFYMNVKFKLINIRIVLNTQDRYMMKNYIKQVEIE